jgi:DNA-3-methyladenine glycosylase
MTNHAGPVKFPLRLSPGFFRRDTISVARRLIGCLLVHGRAAGIIVETEAYTGSDDPGSHACRGPRKRNAPMFGPPGKAYVYKCHKYPLLNVVTEATGRPGAVLLRALEPVRGLPLMRKRSPGLADDELCRGPGRLCRSLGVDLGHNTADLTAGPLYLARWRGFRPRLIARSTRIGLKGAAALLNRRFYAVDSSCVSRNPG